MKWREGRQSCSALHTPESTGSWIRLSWACKSSRLDTSYSGSDRCSRTGEGGAHRKRGTEVRGGTNSSRQEQKDRVKGDSACRNILTLPCNRAYQSDCPGPQCAVMCRTCVTSWKHEESGQHGEEVQSAAVFYPPAGPLMFCMKTIGSESGNENDLDI